jgi:nitric oxide reductase subunit B
MGATWEAFFVSQDMVWFVQGLGWRLVMGIVTLVGFGYLVKDLLSTGANPMHEK